MSKESATGKRSDEISLATPRGTSVLFGKGLESIQPSAAALGKRRSLFAMAALALASLTPHNAEAATTVDGAKDTPSPERPSVPGAEGQANPSQTVHDFKIPAGTLSEVLATLGKETGITFAFSQDKIGTVQSPGVTGVLTVEEALTRVLENTGISARFESADRAALFLTGDTASVDVTADLLASPKYTAPLRDLPQTISVIPQEVLQTTASTSLVEALRTVPGITFGAGEGGNPIGDRPFIRGVDSQASTFVDGMRDIGSQSREVFDLESVEVAKGPSGSYGGRGTSGGSLNLNTKMARREKFLSGTFSPGSSSFYRGTLDGNMKFTDWMSGRMNGLWHSADVAGRDYVKSDRYGFAPATTFNIARRARLNLNYYHLMSNDLPDPGMPYNNPTFRPRTDDRARVFETGDGQPLVINRKAFFGLTNRDYRLEKVKTGFGRVEVDLWEGATLRNTYRFGKSNQDYVYTQADDSQGNIYYGLMWRRNLNRNTAVNTSINQTDLSGHGKTGSVEHTYAAGAEFSLERGWNNSYTLTIYNPDTTKTASLCPYGPGAASGYNCTDLFNPTPNDPWLNSGLNRITKNNNPTSSRTGTRSLYAFDTIRFLPQLQTTLGIRYDHYGSNFKSAITNGTRTEYSRTDDLLNYQAGVTYKPKQSVSIYGSVSSASVPTGNSLAQGSDSSALNSAINANLQPEKTRSVEVGTKFDLFGGRALANAAFFQSNTENVRITLADSTVAAAGTRRNRGLDLGLTGDLGRKLRVFGGYTFMNAILTNAGGAGAANGLQNGTHFPNTPPHSFSITASYFMTRHVNFGGGLYGMTKVWGNESTNKWVPGYTRVDLYGTYNVNKHLDIQGNLLNVGDKIYFSNAYTTHYATLAPGRTGRVTLTVRF